MEELHECPTLKKKKKGDDDDKWTAPRGDKYLVVRDPYSVLIIKANEMT
jgi:hypothetical protein